MRIRFALISEGTSDLGLVVHLERFTIAAGASEADGVPLDLSRLPEPPGRDVASQVSAALRLEPDVHLLFVHRDADDVTDASARAAIDSGLQRAAVQIPHVKIVPIQELEAWLLVDEHAIREVAGNPGGQTPLGLPRLAAVERTKRPKERLRDALERACAHKGRRLREFKADFAHHRRVLLERLDPDGPVCRLDAWIRLVADTKSAVASLADA